MVRFSFKPNQSFTSFFVVTYTIIGFRFLQYWSLLLTVLYEYQPFIKSQITRSDIDHSLFHEEHHIADNDSVVSDSDASDDENDFDDL